MRYRILFSALCTVLGGCRDGEPAPPLIRISSHDYGFDAPTRIPAGLIHFRLVNQGPDMHEAMLVRFTSAAGSAAGYADSVRADVDFPAFAFDIGGTGLAAPGDSNDAWVMLEPGRYAIVCWKGDHLSRGMAQDLEVVSDSSSSAAPPEADLTIVMTEYGYQLTGPLSSGHHVIKVENRGTEPHEADIVRLNPGKTVQEYLEWLRHDEGLPPVEVMGGAGDFVPGRTVWMAVDLVPGRYAIICQVPSPQGKAHFEMGMIREFEVN